MENDIREIEEEGCSMENEMAGGIKPQIIAGGIKPQIIAGGKNEKLSEEKIPFREIRKDGYMKMLNEKLSEEKIPFRERQKEEYMKNKKLSVALRSSRAKPGQSQDKNNLEKKIMKYIWMKMIFLKLISIYF